MEAQWRILGKLDAVRNKDEFAIAFFAERITKSTKHYSRLPAASADKVIKALGLCIKKAKAK
jgi:hypothetical protein